MAKVYSVPVVHPNDTINSHQQAQTSMRPDETGGTGDEPSWGS